MPDINTNLTKTIAKPILSLKSKAKNIAKPILSLTSKAKTIVKPILSLTSKAKIDANAIIYYDFQTTPYTSINNYDELQCYSKVKYVQTLCMNIDFCLKTLFHSVCNIIEIFIIKKSAIFHVI